MRLEIIKPDENFYKILLTDGDGKLILADLGIIPSGITKKMTQSSKNTSDKILKLICKLGCNNKLFTTRCINGIEIYISNIDIQHPYEWWFKYNCIDMQKYYYITDQIQKLL